MGSCASLLLWARRSNPFSGLLMRAACCSLLLLTCALPMTSPRAAGLDAEEHEIVDLKGMSNAEIFALDDIKDPAYQDKEEEEDDDDDDDDDGGSSDGGSGSDTDSVGSDGRGADGEVVSAQPTAAAQLAAKIEPWSAGQATEGGGSGLSQLDDGYIPFGDVDVGTGM